MNREAIICIAQQAEVPIRGHYDEQGLTPQELERFAALIAAAEREACAKVCEEIPLDANPIALTHLPTIERCAAAIRARSEK